MTSGSISRLDVRSMSQQTSEPSFIRFTPMPTCSCPDWAGMCKHVAATLYGVGARLDTAPELLFTLRDVDHLDLISQAVAAENLEEALQGKSAGSLGGADLGEIFGIDIDTAPTPETPPAERPRGNRK